jgi:hypothetical protein
LVDGRLGVPGSYAWNATSGLPCHQKPNDYLIKGKGQIPPTEALLKRNGEYEIDTLAQVNNAKGIGGLIFPIYPELVKLETPEGATVTRSDFGIHFDANVPGSAGCIVLTDREEFAEFCEVMRGLVNRGITTLPLEVRYLTGEEVYSG